MAAGHSARAAVLSIIHCGSWRPAAVTCIARKLGLMKSVALFLLLVTPLLVYAGVDKPWQEDDLGGGRLPGASLLFGVLGAGFLVFQGFKSNDSPGNIFIGAILGFSFGAILGLPVSCMLR